MDHKEQHHQQHEKKRQEEKKEQKQYEAAQENKVRTIHPLWFVAIGVMLIALVVLVWVVVWTFAA